jgi:hypothetical protein
MTAPNLISPTSIYGKTTYISPTGTNETLLLTNSDNSNKTYKISSLLAVNIDGSSAVDCTVKLYNDDTTGTGYAIVNTVAVPADATVILLGKDTPLWIEEDRRITVTASAGDDLTVICSYEEIT